jgi:hypothetical protein
VDIKLRIIRTDETYEVIARPKAIYAFETATKKSILTFSKGDFMAHDIWRLAYEATKCAGKVVPARFEDWLNDLEDVEEVTTPADPTTAAPSAI